MKGLEKKLRDAWLAGFAQSAEGYNAEYPFDGDVVDDPELCKEAIAHAQSAVNSLATQQTAPGLTQEDRERLGVIAERSFGSDRTFLRNLANRTKEEG